MVLKYKVLLSAFMLVSLSGYANSSDSNKETDSHKQELVYGVERIQPKLPTATSKLCLNSIDATESRLELESEYVTIQEVRLGDPSELRVVDKPQIFLSVRRIERYLNRCIRRGTYTQEESVDIYQQVVDVAVAGLSKDTSEFEEKLKENKHASDKLALFLSEK